MQIFLNKNKTKFFLFFIVLIGILFRFYNLNWDQNQHLHPDERFLTMVGNAMKVPSRFSDYFNPDTSTLNPTNVGFKFFVYGTFPLILNKIISLFLQNDTYNNFTIQGRFLSAFFDLLIVLLIFKTVKLFEEKYEFNEKIKYLSSFFYAISVLPIQLSHFFAMDTFLNFFMFSSFYFALRYHIKKTIFCVFLSALFFGCALASKITAFYILPLNLIFLASPYTFPIRNPQKLLYKQFNKQQIKELFLVPIMLVLLYTISSYITVRFADPYIFQFNSFFNLKISDLFLTNINSLKSFDEPNTWFPPSVQWISKPPVVFSLINLILFGLGLPYFILVITGFYYVIRKFRYSIFLTLLLWILIFFIYQSTQFVKTMRYFIFIYPFLAIFAGVGFYYSMLNTKIYFKNWQLLLITLTIIIILLWPISFFSIYTKHHSRVIASEWIYKNIPNGSTILSEHWDDGLPLGIINTYGKFFQNEQLPVFDQDTSEKWQKMNNLLIRGDYLILSSNRGWGSMTAVPERYPTMTTFYADLFADKLPYKKIEEFISYPSLTYLGIPISFPDDWSDESFTVYDHPKVIIFKK